MVNQVIVHYPRDGLTYMIGQCGNQSLSSIKNISEVTCKKCREILEMESINWSDYEYK